MATKPIATNASFDAAYPRALAISCADGRFSRAIEELLHALGHDRLDTLTVPGGPALFNAADMNHLARVTLGMLGAHKTTHVVLIAHQGCGYYEQQYRGATSLGAHQFDDLRHAARTLRAAQPATDVSLYYARLSAGKVVFQIVPAA